MAAGRRNYAAFDLETAGETPEGEDWRDHRPLGITCAALYAPEWGEPVTWRGTDPDGEIADVMDREELALMARQLAVLQERRGFTIVTWNGLGFDFDVLAEESGLRRECAGTALDHVDMMFHVLCKLGHPLGLDAAAKGMKVEGKVEGMDGGEAVRMWREGQREDVIEYCAQDARCTYEVAMAGEQSGSLRWTTRAGRSQSMPLRVGWLTVRQALKLPKPDTGWMTDPIPRENLAGWLEAAAGEGPG